jgi:ABC-type glycerol-3-phosphate transport system substrate-binding protein
VSRRSGIALLGLLSAVSVLAGCGGGGGSTADQGAAKIVPATAPVYIALNTDESSDQWQALKALAARFPGKQKAVEAVESSLRRAAGLDYRKDIAPALGPEIDFAWLDLDGSGDHVVGLMRPKSVAAFERLVA